MFSVLLGILTVKKYAKITEVQPVELKPFFKRRFAVITATQSHAIENK